MLVVYFNSGFGYRRFPQFHLGYESDRVSTFILAGRFRRDFALGKVRLGTAGGKVVLSGNVEVSASLVDHFDVVVGWVLLVLVLFYFLVVVLN